MNRFSVLRALPVFLIAAIGAAVAAPPEVGGKAPDFVLETPQGKKIRLSEAASDKPIVLVVLRGYPGYQCPLCNRQAQDLIKNGPELEAAAGKVILVYPGANSDLKARAGEFLTGKTLPANFDLVLDPEYEFTNLYDLRWNAPQETAYPATFVIDPRGVIVFANISKSHGGRVKASEILAELRKTKLANR